MKGGRFRRWYGNQEYVVNWENDGAEIKAYVCERYSYLDGKWEWVVRNTEHYFRRGITCPKVSSSRFSARLMPEGFIFADATAGLFADNVPQILGVMNSSMFYHLITLVNPTVNTQVGDLSRLPIPQQSSEKLERLVEQAIELAK
ncbi:MAG: hypothetical protein RMI91_00275 [Gemmatales bacterium]|nr:BREX-1 system adenine-specific DNA-methyltransferase PglX [Gemmatales bacterium]MDW7993066.1 hypothetical protein [Gemmatales bacterium]